MVSGRCAPPAGARAAVATARADSDSVDVSPPGMATGLLIFV